MAWKTSYRRPQRLRINNHVYIWGYRYRLSPTSVIGLKTDLMLKDWGFPGGSECPDSFWLVLTAFILSGYGAGKRVL